MMAPATPIVAMTYQIFGVSVVSTNGAHSTFATCGARAIETTAPNAAVLTPPVT